MAGEFEHPVFTKVGDASAEIEALVREIGSPEAAGIHRYYFVSRANQTVVMSAGPSSPIARLLRERRDWMEPGG